LGGSSLLGGIGGVSGAIGQIASLSNFIYVNTDHLDSELEKLAEKLKELMKDSILSCSSGLKPNSALTLKNKNRFIPLVSEGAFVDAISTKKYEKENLLFNRGGINRYDSIFVGIHAGPATHKRTGGLFDSTKSEYTNLCKLAANQVKGYTVKVGLRGTAVVPPRDWVSPPAEEFWHEFATKFEDAIIRMWKRKSISVAAANAAAGIV